MPVFVCVRETVKRLSLPAQMSVMTPERPETPSISSSHCRETGEWTERGRHQRDERRAREREMRGQHKEDEKCGDLDVVRGGGGSACHSILPSCRQQSAESLGPTERHSVPCVNADKRAANRHCRRAMKLSIMRDDNMNPGKNLSDGFK